MTINLDCHARCIKLHASFGFGSGKVCPCRVQLGVVWIGLSCPLFILGHSSCA